MITILDGPLGTELIARGVCLDSAAWSADAILSSPQIIRDIHHDYLHAGAMVLTANTFRTQPSRCGDQWRDLTKQAIAIARERIDNYLANQNQDERQLVTPSRRDAEITAPTTRSAPRLAGSLGPVADCYRPDLSPQRLSEPEHRDMAAWLAECGCDLILCETFANAIEAEIAVRQAARTGCETWIGLTAGHDASLMTPRAMADAASRCAEAGAGLVMVNCTAASKTLPFLAEIEKRNLGVPLGVSANAGEASEQIGWIPNHQNQECIAAAEQYVSLAQKWVEHGASILGGCCGCSPTHIKKLADLFTC